MDGDNLFKVIDGIICLITVIICITVAIVTKVSMFFGFFAALTVISLLLIQKGYSTKEIVRTCITGIKECTGVYVVVILMGASISTWLSSGVIPAIIYHGFSLFKPTTFLVTTFFLTAIVSYFMGTSLGTFSTIGIAMLGIGKGFGMPPEMILGAILSGSFLSDKISPLSGLVNFTLGLGKIDYKSYFRESLNTLIPVIAISSIFYSILGFLIPTSDNVENIEVIKEGMVSGYNLSAMLFIIPLILILMTAKGFKIYISMSTSIILGALSTVIYQGKTFGELINWVLYGYVGNSGNEAVDNILHGGGVINMLDIVFIIMCAVAFGAILEYTMILKPIIDKVIKKEDSLGALSLKANLMSILFLSISCDQSLSIILPLKTLKTNIREKGSDMNFLARITSDAGVIVAPLEFWNVNTIIIVALTGISPFYYGKYTILCYTFPIVSIIYGYVVSSKKTNKHSEEIRRKKIEEF
jgi:NhaC family Na+:H+ antiporter